MAAVRMVAVLAAVAMPVSSRAAEFEITPVTGYVTGGDFKNTSTGESLSLDESSSYGVMLGFKPAQDPRQPGISWIELYLSRQGTTLNAGGGLFLGEPSLDLDIEYYHIGGTYGGEAEGKVQPFVAGSFGATRMVPQRSGLGSESQFSISLGGGARIYLAERVGIRLEARWFGTLVQAEGGFFCSNGACLVKVQGDLFSQYTANAGIILVF
jgi:hypothetical protein